MDTLESLRRKLEGAEEIKSVVRTMKAVAASNIGQYETAVASLGDYYHTVALGIIAYFREEKIDAINEKKETKRKDEKIICAIVFGSDQGLVGQFNDSLTDFVSHSLNALPGKKEIWPLENVFNCYCRMLALILQPFSLFRILLMQLPLL